MVAATLTELDKWFNEPGHTIERFNLLSKLATIELCGWLEEEFDRLIRDVANGRIGNAKWLEENVIDRNHGFAYAKHWRSMLCKVVGEVYAIRVEAAMNLAHPADIPALTNKLQQLWKDRCSFAHADLNANMANAQLTFTAPSVTIQLHNDLKDILGRYETVLMATIPPP